MKRRMKEGVKKETRGKAQNKIVSIWLLDSVVQRYPLHFKYAVRMFFVFVKSFIIAAVTVLSKTNSNGGSARTWNSAKD